MSRIFLSPPHMGGREQDLIMEVFGSNYIAPTGPMLSQFETAFTEYTGIEHCLALASGTAAIHLALKFWGIGPDDFVLASDLTFIGSVSPVTFLGAEPIFVDTGKESWNMDPELLWETCKKLEKEGIRPKAVVVTDLYGFPAPWKEIKKVCDKFGMFLLADAAESVGAKYGGAISGGMADAIVFSFNGNKIITTSGGGMLLSKNRDLIDKARFWSTQARENAPYYEHEEIGYNYRMSNVLAAIGLGQLSVLDERVRKKKWIFQYYKKYLENVPGLSFLQIPDSVGPNYWLTVLLIDQDEFGETPEEIRIRLEGHDIESRAVWKPMHLQPVFKGKRFFGSGNSERLFKKGLCLPSGTALTEGDLEKIIGVLLKS